METRPEPIKLESCPFCGGKVKKQRGQQYKFHFLCNYCKVEIIITSTTFTHAIKQWNTRIVKEKIIIPDPLPFTKSLLGDQNEN